MSLLAFKFIARLLTPAPTNTAIAAGDRVDQALDKLQGQVNALKATSGGATSSVPGRAFANMGT